MAEIVAATGVLPLAGAPRKWGSRALWAAYNRFVSTGGPDLFVVCKSCGSEVSPYITVPVLRHPLRERAPKLDREGASPRRSATAAAHPDAPRLRGGEIPGIRADSHPYATVVLVLLSLVGCLVWRTSLLDLTVSRSSGSPGSEWWRLVTAPFIYNNIGYAFIALGAIALFGGS